MSDSGTTGLVDDWTKHSNSEGDTVLIGYLIFDSQLRDEHIPLRLVGPITFMDTSMGMVQTDKGLYRLGVQRARSKSECRRLVQQLSA